MPLLNIQRTVGVVKYKGKTAAFYEEYIASINFRRGIVDARESCCSAQVSNGPLVV